VSSSLHSLVCWRGLNEQFVMRYTTVTLQCAIRVLSRKCYPRHIISFPLNFNRVPCLFDIDNSVKY